MEIYCFMNQKQRAALNGEKTGIKFPFLGLIPWRNLSKTQGVKEITKQIYRNAN